MSKSVGVKRLSVLMNFGGGAERPVADVVDAPDGYYLEFHPDWLRAGFDLAPALPRKAGVIGPLPTLPGALAGSLPDSWGQLVLDKAAHARGLVPSAPARPPGLSRRADDGRAGLPPANR